MDADDVSLPDRIAAQLQALHANPRLGVSTMGCLRSCLSTLTHARSGARRGACRLWAARRCSAAGTQSSRRLGRAGRGSLFGVRCGRRGSWRVRTSCLRRSVGGETHVRRHHI
jgi:hypothetical protein